MPTVFENYVTDCRVDGKSVQLALWDTAGQEDYERLRPLAYSHAHVLLIAFSVDNPDSLANVEQKWWPEALEHCPNVPIILIGLKGDKREDAKVVEEFLSTGQKFVSERHAEDCGRRICAEQHAGGKHYLECSSLTGAGVDDVFEAATRKSLLASDRRHDTRCCVIL